MTRYLANTLTICRMVCSVLLLCFPAFSVPFYGLYLFCGLSDMVDGTVARKTRSSSEFGARLDTVADLLFTAAAMVKCLPHISLPCWLWIWVAGIAVVKLVHLVWGAVGRNGVVAFHTPMNKATGLLLFLLPMTLQLVEVVYSGTVVCAVATCGALQEGYFMGRTARNNKTSL